MERVIVVGGGLAGVRAVEALRAREYTGALTLVCAEEVLPYDRPPLSKAVLTGDSDDTTVDAAWDALDCDVRFGVTATGLRADERVLETTAGDLTYDGLVIATGADPIRLPGPGPQHVIRTMKDALELRPLLVSGARVVVVGAGWIGAEVATSAAKLGCRVTVLEAAETPVAVALGTELGALTVPWYAEAGVELRCGVKVASIEDGGVALVGGEFLDADAVVVGVGVRPALGWLGDALELDPRVGGIVVDGSLRTSRPEIVAVGDCAAWWSGRYERRMRVEHWDVALNAPEVAVAALLGDAEAVYDEAPYFWSEQFGRMVQFAGHQAGAEKMIFRGDPSERKWAVCWVLGDRLEAILTVDKPRDLVQARRIIGQGTPIDVTKLADPAVAIRNAVLTVS
ncbi:NADPH-dependent 2,4-dienoyl-CoA reductase/sulfur reductase-like enzyme [Actinocorallia herbida]|uniref:NADPH-dependent 2,4-dienoyl-CoA reductase/sulfur reductase-like enzyme n=1 Tax=Actinocorallia herbida TaxID=58109 RepID=A0A3N1CRU2_9ACTN|nr:FAD-dependent oxidoreductase [Actinocorallia herbida]ROO83874.1 NADPH-dependent 2,4-dienoyl-CoA reductase/sulfur reductase-like enzyme [Actinocorallia herbida]